MQLFMKYKIKGKNNIKTHSQLDLAVCHGKIALLTRLMKLFFNCTAKRLKAYNV